MRKARGNNHHKQNEILKTRINMKCIKLNKGYPVRLGWAPRKLLHLSVMQPPSINQVIFYQQLGDILPATR